MSPRAWPLEKRPGAIFIWGAVVCGLLTFPASLWSDEGAAEGTPEAQDLVPTRPQPVVGERLVFQGRWLGVPVGYGWIEVKEITEVEGRSTYHIEAQGHSNEILSALYPIHDVIHAHLDVETLKPLRFEKHQREGDYHADEVVTFDHASLTATYRSLLNQSVKTIAFPSNVQDLISAFYWLRAQPIPSGQPISLNLYTDEKIYETVFLITPPLLLELLKRGTFRCFQVEPKASFKGLLVKRGRLWAYFTADAYRLPLLVQATTPWGPMSAVLDEASIPAELRQPSHARSSPADP